MKGRDNVTPLQESILLLVQIKLNQRKLKEMEMRAFAGASKENHSYLQSILAGYKGLIFPGAEEEKPAEPSYEEQARERLAKEAKNIYMISPHKGSKKDAMRKAAASSDPIAKAIARKELRHEAENRKRFEERSERTRAKRERFKPT